jgi:hypothetical protein
MSELEIEPVEMLGFSAREFRQQDSQFGEPIRLKQILKMTGPEYLKENGILTTTVWSFLYSMSFLRKENLQFEGEMIHEDDYFQLLCFSKVSSIRKIPLTLYFYRIRSNSTMTGSVTPLKVYSYFKLVRLTTSLKNSSLDNDFLDQLRWNYILNMISFMPRAKLDFIKTRNLLSDTKIIFPKTKVNYKDSKIDICENIKKSGYNKQISGLRYEKQIVNHIGTKLYECNILEESKNIELKKEKNSNFFAKHKKK